MKISPILKETWVESKVKGIEEFVVAEGRSHMELNSSSVGHSRNGITLVFV